MAIPMSIVGQQVFGCPRLEKTGLRWATAISDNVQGKLSGEIYKCYLVH